MKFVIGYLLVGVLITVIVFLYSQIRQLLERRTEVQDHGSKRKDDQRTVASVIRENVDVIILTPLAVLIWPLFLVFTVREVWTDWKTNRTLRLYGTPGSEEEFSVTRRDLTERLEIAEIEKRERVHDPLGGAPDLPFGHLNAVWLRFLERTTPEDEIWAFRARWEPRYGRSELREGYAAVRNRTVRHHVVTSVEALDEE